MEIVATNVVASRPPAPPTARAKKSAINETRVNKMHVGIMHVADKFCLTGLKAHATKKYVNSLGNICPSSYVLYIFYVMNDKNSLFNAQLLVLCV